MPAGADPDLRTLMIAAERLRRAARWVSWHPGQQGLPLALAWHVNRRYLAGPAPSLADLPAAPWAAAEAQRLLERSEQRLQSIEAKGPGLATVCAVVAAAAGVAISLTWGDATLPARILLAASAFYGAMSLAAPIKLIGPIERSTISADVLLEIAGEADPERRLAQRCAEAAANNDRVTVRLGNLQAASRNDLRTAALLFAAWAVLALLGLAT